MINIKINNVNYEVEDNKNLIEVLRNLLFDIPSLCFLKNINNNASCRVCLVLDNKTNKLITSCSSKTYDGMDITVDNDVVHNSVKMNLELIAEDHNADCDNCIRRDNCSLKKLCEKYGVKLSKKEDVIIDDSLDTIVRDPSKCILCERCSSVCQNIQNIGCIGKSGRGIKSSVGVSYNRLLKDSGCISCGQCTLVCPTGALHEKSEVDRVIAALNSDKYVVVATAPAIRYAIGEEFGFSFGEDVSLKMVTAFKKLNFKNVFDLNFAADLTIVEEVNELIKRVNTGSDLPMFTSCCPAWFNYVEKHESSLLHNLSSCKSPQEMMASVIKEVYAKEMNIDKNDLYIVMAMPCVAKKGEKTRFSNVDAVLTTREVISLFNKFSINLKELTDSNYDSPLGVGNSEIFGVSGGVMVSALRTFANLVTGQKIKDFDFQLIEDLNGSSEYKIKLLGNEYKFAILNGIASAKKLIKSGKINEYTFIEVMSCPSGCINGGGQPIVDFDKFDYDGVVFRRSNSMKRVDCLKKDYDSKENEYIVKLYKNHLGKPSSDSAKSLLHTKKEH